MARQFATIALLTLMPSALGFSSSIRMSAHDAASSPLLSDRRDSLRRLALASAAASLTALAPPSARAVGQAAEDGLVKSPSGLAYYVTTEAKGGAVSTPTRGQRVVVDYTLWLIKPGAGRIFVDSTRGYKKEPLTFTVGVGEVIKGWDEAVLSMKVGEARWLIVPPSLGYGETGTTVYGGAVPGGATLYFDMELKAVEPLEQQTDEQKKWLDEHPL